MNGDGHGLTRTNTDSHGRMSTQILLHREAARRSVSVCPCQSVSPCGTIVPVTSLAAAVRETIRRHDLLVPGETVLVACSGGADSVALLSLLKELEAELDLTVRAAHVNHHLRASESDADEAYVREMCAGLGVPLDCLNLDLGRARERGNLEDAARRERYDLLAGVAASLRAVVATGHTLNDQAETFLMKLFRGAGPGGLSGIAIRRTHPDPVNALPVRVVRPLLRADRREILAYLEERRLGYRIDRSNLDTRFDRNWVRHELIPLLEQRLNPRVIQVLGRTAGLFHEIDDFLEHETWQRLGSPLAGERELRLPIEALKDLPEPLRKSAVRIAYLRVQGKLTDLTQQHVAATLGLLEGTSGRRIDLPGEIVVQREFDLLRVGPPPENLQFSYRVDWPGEIVIPEVGKKVVIRTSPEDRPGWLVLPEGPLIVRNRRPGDRYKAAPRTRERALKKILIERRIPVSLRNRLLVFECGDRIVWVEGFPPASVAPSPSSQAHTCEIRIETFGHSSASK